MPDDQLIPEFYSDTFEFIGSAFGTVLNFNLSPPVPRMQNAQTVARIRMSWEHIKAMTFIMARQVKKVERDTGVTYPLPNKILNDLNIAKEDWDSFWKSEKEL